MSQPSITPRSRHVSVNGHRASTALLVATFLVAVGAIVIPAQTTFTLDRNKYTLENDVAIGREAAAQVSKELPQLNDARTEEWAEDVGRGLVAALPPEFSHPPFRYTFDVVNQKEINAFALPGGPMFLNRGMIEAGTTEAEVAGVMGHEIAHVALRHGTAQATKGERFQLGALAGQVLGAVVGGTVGGLIAQGSQFGLGTYFLKFGREYERQADLLGAQILARAGYDPRQMANMFKTIESQGGSQQPEWMSSHPNPGNRYDAILREAAMLRIQGSADSGDFADIKGRLAKMSPALTAEQIARANTSKAGSTGAGSTGTRAPVRVDPPSSQSRAYRPNNVVTITVPANWQPTSRNDGVTTYAPVGGTGEHGFTHGIQVGVVQNATGDLQRDMEQMIQGFAQSNPRLQRQQDYTRENIGGRTGLTTVLSNVSDITGQAESVTVSITQLRGNTMLFLVGVTPQTEASVYGDAFRRIRQSIQVSD